MKHNRQGTGELSELYLENGLIGGRLLCNRTLIPTAGQYMLAYDRTSDAPLPVPIFNAGIFPGGFVVAPPLPQTWQPGITLSLRGPLGRGFSMPVSARRVALAALCETAARLNPLLVAAMEQGASVVLVSNLDLFDLPAEIEIQPLSALADVVKWADYLALDLPRESLTGLREKLGFGDQLKAKLEAQMLVVTSMPCSGMAECGVCAVIARHGWRMTCKDGPVFSLTKLV